MQRQPLQHNFPTSDEVGIQYRHSIVASNTNTHLLRDGYARESDARPDYWDSAVWCSNLHTFSTRDSAEREPKQNAA